jgi:hypothetical protein
MGIKKRTMVVSTMLLAWGVLDPGKLAAQDASQPPLPSSVIPLERTEAPPQATGAPPQASAPVAQPDAAAPAIMPSNQAHDSRSHVGTAEIAGLRNPFERGGHGRKRGLLRMVSPETEPTPAAPTPGFVQVAPVPGKAGMPGMPAAPGVAPEALAPWAGAAPGAELAPGTAPGALAPSAPALGTPEASALESAAGEAAFEAAAGAAGPGFGGGLSGAGVPGMIGDMSPFTFQSARSFASNNGNVAPPHPPGPHGAAPLFPTVRSFKISENMSPRPQDRIFYDFNYYNNLNGAVNAREGTQVSNMKAYVNIWGVEKTFNDGMGSIGLRLPLNTLTADSPGNNISTPTSTALGNLTIFGKYILAENRQTGSLISVGLAVTPSTGTSRFGGAPYINALNSTYIQPFVGYIWNMDRFFVQGFSAFDFPSNNNDVTLMYNDVGMGYFAYRSNQPGSLLSAIVPAFEVHVNSPLNHRNPFNIFDPAASPNVVNLTYGLNMLFAGRAMLTCALVTPVTSPKPFDAEAVVFLNIYFGRTVRSPLPILPPVIQ